MAELLTLLVTYMKISLYAIGGGVATLPEMQRDVVDRQGWLTAGQFRDSYALGQLTPGPGMLMVMVAGYNVAGLLGAFVAVVGMFLPTSLLTYVVGRSWGALRESPLRISLQAGLAPVGAGLMLAGAYTVARSSIDGPVTALIGIAATIVLFRTRLFPAAVIFLSAGAGALFLR